MLLTSNTTPNSPADSSNNVLFLQSPELWHLTQSLFLLLTLLIFFLNSPTYDHHRHDNRRSLVGNPNANYCSSIFYSPTSIGSFGTSNSGNLLNYSSLHQCLFPDSPILGLPILLFLLLIHFSFLIHTAADHFSTVVSTLSSHLRLSPSMGAVTLLALGNGAPDVFASIAAVRSGQPRTGLGAILSAGAFVSALVVGLVAVYSAPFAVDPAPFVRDVFFYLLAVSGLFYVYLSAEIYLWQAVGFVGFYLFFVGFVFWMDLGVDVGRKLGEGDGVEEVDVGVKMENGKMTPLSEFPKKGSMVAGVKAGVDDERKSALGFCSCVKKISRAWEVPISTILKLSVPSTSPSPWSRFYSSANIIICPLLLLYSFRSFIPLDHPIAFIVPQIHFPLWSIILFTSLSLGLVHYILEKDPPETEMIPRILMAFVMSVFWISTMAGELLDCLAAIGIILNLPPALLGLTVLAWGNSVGDLFADVAVAKAGQPAMAMAGCFAGPMFNMLVGLGTALVIESGRVYPEAYELRFHISIVVAFVFLLLSLMGSLLVVTWFRFRVTRFWGFCLIGLYLLFTAISFAIAIFSS